MTADSTVNQVTVSQSDGDRHAALLQRNRWFRDLPADCISEMVSMARLRRLEDGQRLHARGDLPDGLYGVSTGAMRISNTGADGREALLTVLSPGNWFGEISLFDGLPRTHDAHAMGVTELLLIPRTGFQQLLERRPELYPHFMRLLCRRLRQSFNMMEDSALLPLPARLAKRLLMHAQYYGDVALGNERLSIQLSQEVLGLMLNSSRQSINKLLKKLEQAGWIRIHYSQITILDEEALTRLANGTDHLA
ncbi:MAG TPA: Crp/Fnr family transcriptional regulator [Candidatus Pseudomonas excrementavium]|uniref:Crp/Fnr family transcriptional regulator n=1 Tax=Halopseudomonas bauzanensis TaxID=653930 RepID=UPI001C3A8A03|nr:Crp/Fnr family transcriptional regulator [Halopseudomonas bauzanensis]HIZ51257.1 Crp/Fnr family transcriptional regulator [Candidatus Pseudomonas excrementavium]